MIIDVPGAPASISLGVTAPALMLKSFVGAVPRLNFIGPVEWFRVPEVPVTVTVNWAFVTPDANVHISCAVCGVDPNVTLEGRVHVAVVDGTETDCARFTVPVNPFRAFDVIVEAPDEVLEVTGFGDALRLKSVTWNVMTAVA